MPARATIIDMLLNCTISATNPLLFRISLASPLELSGGKAGVVIHHKLSVIWRACVPFMCVVILCAGGFPLLMRLHERPPGTL
mmetsp:Transcript_23525/g.34538  ORF Transcript_23525/g.34538 Transcript_23525/m.34538 type:complete len:83 (-) Transcript_23525:147-395(-)